MKRMIKVSMVVLAIIIGCGLLALFETSIEFTSKVSETIPHNEPGRT